MAFTFGGDTGMTFEQMLRERARADMLAEQIGQGGYTALGAGLASRIHSRRAERAQKNGSEEAKANAQSALGQVFGARFGGQPMGAQPGRGGGAMPLDPMDPTAIAGDTMAALGKDNGTADYRASLIGTESGGNWKAQNGEMGAGGQAGHFGRVQFGQARLQEAMDAGAIPQGTTPEQFMASPALQIAAENWHFGDLESQLGDLVGSNVNGKPLDMGALVAMGHLGGAGGARKHVESGGRYNPSDSFGTSLSEYAQTHGGPQTTMSAQNVAGQPDMAALVEAMSDPYLDEGTRSVLGQMFQQQLQRQDPAYQMQTEAAQLELERARFENEQMRNPRPDPGYKTLTPQEATGLGLADGGVYQVSPKGEISVLQQPPNAIDGNEYGLNPIMGVDKNGNQVVLQLGKDGSAVATQFPEGVKPDMSLKAYETAQGAAMGRGAGEAQVDAQVALPGASIIAEEIKTQIDTLKNDPYLDNMLGPVDSLMPNITEDAARVQGLLDQLQGGTFLQARQMLKGGGAITDYEGQKAEAAFARLNKAQTPEDFKAALDDFYYFVDAGIKKLGGQSRGEGLGRNTVAPAGGLSEGASKWMDE